jgi:NADP-reducing hydrogenase subunit HndB
MAKLTRDDLEKLRGQKCREISSRGTETKTETKNAQIIVAMGTCGIAAGAKETLSAFVDELAKGEVENVTIRQTGCMGLCHSEPTVEIAADGMPSIIYGKVDAETARKIVQQHIGRSLLLNDRILDRPSIDIVCR